MSDVLMTQNGLENLVRELDRLQSERELATDRIRFSLENGGPAAENGEYTAASGELNQIERRIGLLEERFAAASLAHAESDGEVDIGETVRVKELGTGVLTTFRIVGAGESEPDDGDISYESPVGAALLGCRVADIVEVRIPRGMLRLEIVAVHE